MPVIKSITKDGANCTSVMPEADLLSTIETLRSVGHTAIHDAETGEKYEDDEINPDDIPF